MIVGQLSLAIHSRARAVHDGSNSHIQQKCRIFSGIMVTHVEHRTRARILPNGSNVLIHHVNAVKIQSGQYEVVASLLEVDIDGVINGRSSLCVSAPAAIGKDGANGVNELSHNAIHPCNKLENCPAFAVGSKTRNFEPRCLRNEGKLETE
jgi:hypothetical protein